MARSQRNSKLENRTSRLRLPIGQRVYVQIAENLALGYRRSKSGHGSWQVRFRVGSQYFFKHLGNADDFGEGPTFFSYFQAQDRAREYFQKATCGHTAKKQDLTVSECLDYYMTWFENHRKGVRETRANIQTHIQPFLGKFKVTDLTPSIIRNWHENLAQKPARRRTSRFQKQKFKDKPQTQEEKRARQSTSNRILTCLKAALNRCYHDGLIENDQAWKKVKPFPKVNAPRVRFLTDSECIRLLNSCPLELRFLVQAALHSGLRYSELANLKVEDVNLKTALLFVAPGKSGLSRYVPLNDEALEFFAKMIQGKNKTDLIFSLNGHKWGKSHHLKMLRKASQSARIIPEIRFHELRHTYASHLAQAGVDLHRIAKILGHSDLRITSKFYAHLADQHLREAVDKLPSLKEPKKDFLQEVKT